METGLSGKRGQRQSCVVGKDGGQRCVIRKNGDSVIWSDMIKNLMCGKKGRRQCYMVRHDKESDVW